MVFCPEAMQEIGQVIYAGGYWSSYAEGSAILEQGRKAYPNSTRPVISLKAIRVLTARYRHH